MGIIRFSRGGWDQVLARPATRVYPGFAVVVKVTGRIYQSETGQVLSVEVQVPDDMDIPALRGKRRLFVRLDQLSRVVTPSTVV